MSKWAKPDGCIVICGAGDFGKRVFRFLNALNYKGKVCFCDKNSELKTINGIYVISYEEAAIIENASYIISGIYAKEMMNELLNYGVLAENIYIYNPQFRKVGNDGGSFYVADSFFEDKAPKVVYSFGIGENLSFSEEILKLIQDIEIYAFDPTPKAIQYVKHHPLYKCERFHFFPWGISSKDEETLFYLPKNKNYVSGSLILYDGVDEKDTVWVTMKRLDTIMKDLGHNRIDMLKMDIEGSEFDVVPSIMKTERIFDYLCIELHNRFFLESENKKNLFLKQLEKYGFSDIYAERDEYLIAKSEEMLGCIMPVKRK